MKERHNVSFARSVLLVLMMLIAGMSWGALLADDIEVEGFIEVIGGDYLIVESTQFFVDSNTEIEDLNGDEIDLQGLIVGQFVEVEAEMQDDSTYLAEEIEVEEPEADIEAEGLISDIGSDSLVVNGITFFVDSATVVLDDDDNPIAFGALQVGDEVEVEAIELNSRHFLAFLIELEDEDGDDDDQDIEVEGAIEFLADSSLTVAGIEFLIDENTEVRCDDDEQISFADLQVGMIVEVDGHINSNGIAVADEIEIEDFQNDEVELTGDIESITSDEIVVLGKAFTADSSTAVFDNDNNPIAYAELAVGMLVEIKGQIQPDGSCLATRIKLEDNSRNASFAGKLENRSGGSITVNQTELVVNDHTLVRNHANQVIALDALLLDSDIEVEALTNSDGVLLAEEITLEAGPRFATSNGFVNAISSGSITVGGISADVPSNTVILDEAYNKITWQEVTLDSPARIWTDTDASGTTTALQIRLLDNSATSIGGDENAVPGYFELAQNFPNPFNPNTTVPLSIQGPGEYDVKIAIYNLVGQQVRNLVNEQLSSGNYQFSWDAMTDNGQPLPSGVYMLQLNVDHERVQTLKMILLK